MIDSRPSTAETLPYPGCRPSVVALDPRQAGDAGRRAPGSSSNRHKRVERLQILLDLDELAAIDDWRFRNRMPSRAATVRELLRRGLLAEQFDAPHTKGTRSIDFGVTTAT